MNKKKKINHKRRKRIEESDRLKAKWGTQQEQEIFNEQFRDYRRKGMFKRK